MNSTVVDVDQGDNNLVPELFSGVFPNNTGANCRSVSLLLACLTAVNRNHNMGVFQLKLVTYNYLEIKGL